MPVSNPSGHGARVFTAAVKSHFPSTQDTKETSSMNGEVKQISNYDHLLLQVESLKIENNSLKKELVTNTSQINRLESEASNLKKMVVMLGNSIKQNSETNTAERDCICNAAGLLNKRNCLGFDKIRTTSGHMTQDAYTDANACGSFDQSLSSFAVSEIRRRISNHQIQRSAILNSLRQEEIIKEKYMKQLNNMNDQLKDILDTDEAFSPTTENVCQRLEAGIQEIRETMARDLGTPNLMQQRVQDWLRQIKTIENEIYKLQQQYFFLVNQSARSFVYENESLLGGKALESGHGLVERHKLFIHKNLSLTNVSTQTSHCNFLYKTLNEQKLKSVASSLHGKGKECQLWSRSTQTVQSCVDTVFQPGTSGCYELQAEPRSFMSGDKLHHSEMSYAAESDTMLGFPALTPAVSSVISPKLDAIDVRSKLIFRDPENLSRSFLSLSTSVDSSRALRQTGCLPLLIQLLHDGSLLPVELNPLMVSDEYAEKKREIRKISAEALKNIVCSGDTDKRIKVESHVLDHLESLRAYCESLYLHVIAHVKTTSPNLPSFLDDTLTAQSPRGDLQPTASFNSTPDDIQRSIHEIMHLSYGEPTRGAIIDLGGLHCVIELFMLDCYITKQRKENGASERNKSLLLRHYAGLILTNLTFGHAINKVLVMKTKGLLDVIVEQLSSKSEEIQQAMASILRNLSWQADEQRRDVLREKGVVRTLTSCAISVKREATLKSMLSALWNLSGHCSQNRLDICSVEGTLSFLVSSLTYKSPSNSTHVTENGGGILRNVSSIIATNEEYRKVLRAQNCLQVLLKQLTSPSLTIVSNACGTLWNLSARDETDQHTLWELGAVGKLRKLIHSKHNVIAQGSSATLRNLLASRPEKLSSIFSEGSKSKNDMPSLQGRKLKQLESELKQATSQASSELSDHISQKHQAEKNLEYSTALRSQHLDHQKFHASSQLQFQNKELCSSNVGKFGQLSFVPTAGKPIYAWKSNKARISSTNTLPKCSGSFLNHESMKSRTIHTCSNNEIPCESLNSKKIMSGNYHPPSDFKPVRTWGNHDNVSNLNNNNIASTIPRKEAKSPTISTRENSSPLNQPRIQTNLEEKSYYLDGVRSLLESEDAITDHDSLRFTDERHEKISNQGSFLESSLNQAHLLIDCAPKPSLKSRICFENVSISAKLNTDSDSGFSANLNQSQASSKSEQTGDILDADADISNEQPTLHVGDETFTVDDTLSYLRAICAEEQLHDQRACTPVVDQYVMQGYQDTFADQLSNINHIVSSVDQQKAEEFSVNCSPVDFNTRISSINTRFGPIAQSSNEQVEPVNSKNVSPIQQPNQISANNKRFVSGYCTKGGQTFENNPRATTLLSCSTQSSHYSDMSIPNVSFYRETPLMYSPSSSRSPLESVDITSVLCCSEPESKILSGMLSPSDLPDSPDRSISVDCCSSQSESVVDDSEQVLAQPASFLGTTDPAVEKVLDERDLKENIGKITSSTICNVTIPQDLTKTHAMPVSYLSTLPSADEIEHQLEERAMSDRVGCGSPNIENEKREPISYFPLLRDKNEIFSSTEKNKKYNKATKKLKEGKKCRVAQAGYVTSLPTGAEIRQFAEERGLSHATSLSKTNQCSLRSDKFQSDAKSLYKTEQSQKSIPNIYANLSSAVGSYILLSPSSQSGNQPGTLIISDKSTASGIVSDNKSMISEVPQVSHEKSSTVTNSSSEINDICNPEEKEDNTSLIDLLDSSSDDNDELMEKYIELAIPKKYDNNALAYCCGKSNPEEKVETKQATKANKVSANRPVEEFFKSNPHPHKAEKVGGDCCDYSEMQWLPDPNSSELRLKLERKNDSRSQSVFTNSHLNEGDSVRCKEEQKHTIGVVDLLNELSESETYSANRKQALEENVMSEADSDRLRYDINRKTVETLGESYSVLKQIKDSEKPKVLTEMHSVEARHFVAATHDQSIVQDVLLNRSATSNTEVSSQELSTLTSVTNLTLETEFKAEEFNSQQRQVTEKDAKNQNVHPSEKCTNTEPISSFRIAYEENNKTPHDVQNKEANSASRSNSNKSSDHRNTFEQESLLDFLNSQTILDDLGAHVTNMTTGALPGFDKSRKFDTEGRSILAPKRDSDAKITSCDRDLADFSSFLTENKLFHKALDNTCPVKITASRDKRAEVVSANKPVSESDQDQTVETSILQHYDNDHSIKDNPARFTASESSTPTGTKNDPDAVVFLRPSLLPHHGNLGDHHQEQNTLIYPSNPTSPSDAEWAIVHRGANAVAASLCEMQHIEATSPLSLASLSSSDHLSTSFSLSTGPTTLTSDGFYRLSRQSSFGDSFNSDMSMSSMVLGCDVKSLVKTQSKNKPRILKGGQSGLQNATENKAPVVKGSKKIYRSPITGKPRENLSYPSRRRDGISAIASDAKCKEKRYHNSGRGGRNTRDLTRPSLPSKFPVSSSMGRIGETVLGCGRNPSLAPSKTASKSKPVRSRSDYSGYQSSRVTKLHPVMRETNSRKPNSVASVRARGDKTLTERSGPTSECVPVANTGQCVGPPVQRPVLVKQGTFIKDEPSPTLLKSVAQSTVIANKKQNKAHSTKLVKTSCDTDSKKEKKIWKDVKKSFSPKEESNLLPSTITQKKTTKSRISDVSRVSQPDGNLNPNISMKKIVDSQSTTLTWSGENNDFKDLKVISKSATLGKDLKQSEVQGGAPSIGNDGSSGRSNSSSSVSSGNSGSSSAVMQRKQQPGKSFQHSTRSGKNIPSTGRVSRNKPLSLTNTSANVISNYSKASQVRKPSREHNSSTATNNVGLQNALVRSNGISSRPGCKTFTSNKDVSATPDFRRFNKTKSG